MTSNLVEALDELLFITSFQLFRNSTENKFIIKCFASQTADHETKNSLENENDHKNTI